MFQILYNVACICEINVITESYIFLHNASAREGACSEATQTKRVHSLSCLKAFPLSMFCSVVSTKVSWNCRYRLGYRCVEDIIFIVKVDTLFGPMFCIVENECYAKVKEWQLGAVLVSFVRDCSSRSHPSCMRESLRFAAVSVKCMIRSMIPFPAKLTRTLRSGEKIMMRSRMMRRRENLSRNLLILKVSLILCSAQLLGVELKRAVALIIWIFLIQLDRY